MLLPTGTDVPTVADSLVYYTGRMPFGGTLVGADWHSHGLKFQSSLLAAASPLQLGLASADVRDPRFQIPLIPQIPDPLATPTARLWAYVALMWHWGFVLVCTLHGIFYLACILDS